MYVGEKNVMKENKHDVQNAPVFAKKKNLKKCELKIRQMKVSVAFDKQVDHFQHFYMQFQATNEEKKKQYEILHFQPDIFQVFFMISAIL